MKINKIIVKICTTHYVKSWTDRNEMFNDPDKQRKYVIEKLKATEELIMRSNKVDVIRCAKEQVFDTEKETTRTIQARIRHLMETHKKTNKRIKASDIRSFFNIKGLD